LKNTGLCDKVRMNTVRMCPWDKERDMRVTSKGQVTIPQAIREKAGILPGAEVEFVISGDKVYIRKVTGKRSRGSGLIRKMRGKAGVSMSTDQIMALTRGE